MITKQWVTVVLLLLAAVLFLVGALQIEPANLDNAAFDELIGLTFASLGLAIWAAPA